MSFAASVRVGLLALLAGFALSAAPHDDARADDGFSQGSNPGAATEVRLVYEITPNPPRHLGEGTAIDWERPGLTLELLRLVGERLDVNFLFQRVPWKRGLFLVEQGLADGIFHTSYMPERESLLVYPRLPDGRVDDAKSIFVQSYLLYVKKGSPLRWDGTRFENLDGPIGAITSYSVVDALHRLGVEVVEERALTINLRKLIEGRIAASAELETMADSEIARQPAFHDAIEKLPVPVRQKPYFLTFGLKFRETHGKLAERIWQAIADVKDSAEFAAIERSYE